MKGDIMRDGVKEAILKVVEDKCVIQSEDGYQTIITFEGSPRELADEIWLAVFGAINSNHTTLSLLIEDEKYKIFKKDFKIFQQILNGEMKKSGAWSVKISSIKFLRETTLPQIPLKEAKFYVEHLMSVGGVLWGKT